MKRSSLARQSQTNSALEPSNGWSKHRDDGVETNEGVVMLMELEQIEPVYLLQQTMTHAEIFTMHFNNYSLLITQYKFSKNWIGSKKLCK